MSQVVYVPHERRETLGSDIGGLVGAMIGSAMMANARQQRLDEQRLFIDGLKNAPDRASAMEVLSNTSSKFKTPQDFTMALKLVDEFHPASLETPTPVTAYSPDTGEPTTVFPNRRQMADPKYWKGSGVTLTKPDMADFYQPIAGDVGERGEQNYQHVGKLPVGKRPEGAVTLPELRESRQGRTEARADERLRIAESRLARAAKEGTGQSTVKAAVTLSATALNAKALPDGSWDFGGDANKAEQFTQMVEYISTRVEANPAMLKTPTAATRLFTEARRAILGHPEDKPAPEAPPKKKGLVDRLLGEDKQAGESTMSAADQKASLDSAKAAIDRVRASDMPAADKKAALDKIRKALKDAGLRSDM